MADVDFFAPGARLALELECLLVDTRNDAAQSRWWDSAHEALEQWRQAVRAMEASIDAAQPEASATLDLRKRAETAWQRGFQQGLGANRLLATQAMDALKKEREAHAETNRAMTDALLMMEEREQRIQRLLRQALDALEQIATDLPWELTGIQADAIAALRERLGEGEPQ